MPLLRAEADRLTERRLTALDELYAAELACAHPPALVPELAELAARHPMRERLLGLLMTALYRAGRRAEALKVYCSARAALVEELGLEPGAELQGHGEARTLLERSLGLRREYGDRFGEARATRCACGGSCDSRGNRPERSSASASCTRTPATGRPRRPTARREARRLFVELGAPGTEGA